MARRVSETRKSSFTAAHQNKEMFKHEGHNSSKLFSQPHSLLHEQHEQKPTAKVSNQLHQTNILTSKTDQSRKWTHPSAAAAKTIAKKCYNYGFLLMLLLGSILFGYTQAKKECEGIIMGNCFIFYPFFFIF